MKRAALLALMIVFLACGPRLPKQMPIPEVMLSDLPAGTSGAGFIEVGEFLDGRSNSAMVVYDGKEIAPEAEVSSNVQRALRAALVDRGFEVDSSAPVVVRGEVRKWLGNVTSGFAGKVESEASVYVEVYDPAEKRIYSGTYHGSSSIQHPSLDQKRVEESLRVAMTEALRQVVNDTQLVEVLGSF